MSDKIYAVIDLKSFYASVECRERALDPLTTILFKNPRESYSILYLGRK